MANSKHLAILENDVEVWNEWRKDNPDICPDLKFVVLEKKNLAGANFRNTDLRRAHFKGTDLFDADFQGANLQFASFIDADLIWATVKGADLQNAVMHGTDVTGVKYDNFMKCYGINIQDCFGSQRFVRHVMDLSYIEEFKDQHPTIHYIWEMTSNCGRSWFPLLLWSCFIIYIYWALFDFFPHIEHPLYTSIMTFTSFGFIDSHNRGSQELFLLCTEAILGYIVFGCLVSLIANKMARRSG
ncbi:pentapeptide repeat-containing protein [Pseudodesulfovibrio portus]|uniref:Potassium channel domain-containing protein n=1 Tax=Pseudodesulfovibrio portus TaxID=231439 RepID=A0ABM8ART2_9BACT|nr:pentapeptide repeat-containing protein [Pseudodesulfovibrio portus]BDQ34017.1 hypothetical protein JCM14722_15590 [Pseudodesulfovibrio portus]